MIIAFINFKGGTGKTSIAVNCAALWAQAGHTVALYDFDPQQNATTYAPNIGAVSWHGAKIPNNSPSTLTLLDTPPTWGPQLQRALGAADVAIVPVHEYSALQGVRGLLDAVAATGNTKVKVLFALTMMDARSGHCKAVEAALRRDYGPQTLKATISRSYTWADATAAAMPIHQYAPRHKGAAQMKQLAGEIYDASFRTNL
jgi:chromosome partitioning protein